MNRQKIDAAVYMLRAFVDVNFPGNRITSRRAALTSFVQNLENRKKE